MSIHLENVMFATMDAGALRCEVCLRVLAMQPGDAARYTEEGWPRCHDYTMKLMTVEETSGPRKFRPVRR